MTVKQELTTKNIENCLAVMEGWTDQKPRTAYFNIDNPLSTVVIDILREKNILKQYSGLEMERYRKNNE